MTGAAPVLTEPPKPVASRAQQPAGTPGSQRRCGCGGLVGPDRMCARCRSRRLALRRTPAGPSRRSAPPIVHDVLRSPGRRLEPSARGAFEARLGHDFGHVRVHTDERAGDSADAVGAHAYTVGSHVVFGRGAYAPRTPAGQRLLAHELVHVLQHGRASSQIPAELPVGRVDDDAEREADRLAVSPQPRGASVSSRPTALRGAFTTPQTVGERRASALPKERRSEETVRVHVTRSLEPCPCSRIEDTREGIFYNPDLDNLAIAYRHCRGRRTTDVYGRLESDASSFLSGTAPPVGTARAGIDVNVVGRVVGGRVVVEAIGTNVGGAGIGGRAQIVFQGGEWRVFLEPQFLRRLGAAGGAGASELEVSLGGRLGPVSARVDVRALLDPSPTVRGTACLPGPGGTSVCGFGETGPGGGVTVGGSVGGSVGGPEVRREEDCAYCLCPAPARVYTCVEDVLPRREKRLVPVERDQELRYYFGYNATAPSEEAALRTSSDASLGTAATQLGAGGSAIFITGYASPEGTERYNAGLSERRGIRLRDLLAGRVGPEVSLPEPSGGGELLGARPRPTPSSRLDELIVPMGFRSAEDLSVLLLGEAIPRAELRDQFVSLLTALDTPEDRLALFGLATSDPIAAGVHAAVEEFLRARGRGGRPWERVFRLLRYAVVRVRRTEIEKQVTTIDHADPLSRLTEADCRPHAAKAERSGLFGPIDTSALRPSWSASELDRDCGPSTDDLRRGCAYELPSRAARRGTSAPDFAPREVGR